MAVVILTSTPTKEELRQICEDYSDFIKVVVDIEKEILAAGGEWHSDAEKILLEQGSLQKNLWGGGLRLSNAEIDFISLINTRPNLNRSQEVFDPEIRAKMEAIIRKIFEL